jgi:uncharacterized repeat protein (TIGR01451 family)
MNQIKSFRCIQHTKIAALLVLLLPSLLLGQVLQFPQYFDQNTPVKKVHSAIMTCAPVIINPPNQARYGKSSRILDTEFADMVERALFAGNVKKFNEVAFAFMECNGGGMIDELMAIPNLAPASFTSAAHHKQCAWARFEDAGSGADPTFGQARRIESTYNLNYALNAGGGVPATQRNAARLGYNSDILSPPNQLATYFRFPYFFYSLFSSYPIGEIPQYTSTGADGDAITLNNNNLQRPGNPNKKYLAILFGGSTWLENVNFVGSSDPRVPYWFNVRLGINYNTLKRMYDALIAANYDPDNIYVLAPYTLLKDKQGGATKKPLRSDGKVLTWVDDESTREGMQRAWDWVAANTDADTQVFFWSSWGHGTAGTLAQLPAAAPGQRGLTRVCRGSALPLETPVDFATQMQDTFNFYSSDTGASADGLPDFEVEVSSPITNLQAFLDGHALSLRSTSPDPVVPSNSCVYSFALSADDIRGLLSATNHQVWIDYPTNQVGNPDSDCTDRVLSMGLTLGELAGGPSLGTSDAQPELTIAQTNGSVVLSWPDQVTGWNLQASSSISGGFTNIGTLTNNSMTLPAAGPKRFFRLSKSRADVAIASIEAPTGLPFGSNVTYTITITNNSPTSATAVTFTESVPDGTSFVSVNSSQGSCTNDSGIITGALGNLAPHSSATITLILSPDAPGDIVSIATVSSGCMDDNPENNLAIDLTTVVP